MKKNIGSIMGVLWISILINFLLVGAASATPLYYTFEGAVSFFERGAPPDGDIQIGDAVSYTFLVDTDLGASINVDGVVTDYPDGTASWGTTYDNFYTELVSGQIFEENLVTPFGEIIEENWGYIANDGDYSRLNAGSMVSVGNFNYENSDYSPTGNFFDWTIGTELYAQDHWSNAVDMAGALSSDYLFGVVESEVVLTSISHYMPSVNVPGPASIYLMIIGLVYLRYFSHIRQRDLKKRVRLELIVGISSAVRHARPRLHFVTEQ